MEPSDRDTLIRVEQQLKDSIQNQGQILEIQRDISQKVERDSKQLTVLTGDVKGHLESSKIRWEELEKKLNAFDKRVIETEKSTKDNIKDITAEKEERIKFDQSVAASARTAKWIATILGSLAALVSAILAVSLFFKGVV